MCIEWVRTNWNSLGMHNGGEYAHDGRVRSLVMMQCGLEVGLNVQV